MTSVLLFGIPEKFTLYEVAPRLSLGLLFIAGLAGLLGVVFLFKSSTRRNLRIVAGMLLALALVYVVISVLVMSMSSPWPLPVYSGVLALIAAALFIRKGRA